MNKVIEEIKESTSLILNTLESIDSKLEQQEEGLKVCMNQNPASLEANEVLIAELRSIKISFELLRDEVDELHQLTAAFLFKGEQG